MTTANSYAVNVSNGSEKKTLVVFRNNFGDFSFNVFHVNNGMSHVMLLSLNDIEKILRYAKEMEGREADERE